MAHLTSYSHVLTCNIPRSVWDEAWFTLQSWKGYLQSFPGFIALRMAARELDNGDIRFHTMTVWEYPEQLQEWRASQWSADALLHSISDHVYDMDDEIFEDFM